jgi:hypothetical protein
MTDSAEEFSCTMKPSRLGFRLPNRTDGGWLRIWTGESHTGQWMWLLSHQFGCHAVTGLEGFDYTPVDVDALPELRDDIPIRQQVQALWEGSKPRSDQLEQ